MTATASTAPPPPPLRPVTLELLRHLLGVEAHETARTLMRRAEQASSALPQLVVSAAVAEGLPIGSGSRDLLRRARERAARYAELYARLAAELPVRLVKGLSLGERYPAPLLRPVGDLDLVLPGEDELWRAAVLIAERVPLDRADLALSRDGDRTDLTLGLHWAAEDDFLDRPYNVELATLPFPRTPGGPVSPHRTLPAAPWPADLLSLAEERFQRPFHAKDVVDVLVLFAAPDRLTPEALATAATGHHLAPELRELLAQTREGTEAEQLDPYLRALDAPAAAELAARQPAERPSQASATVEGRLAAGLPVYGMPLGTPAARPGLTRAHRHDAEGVCLLRTPIGDYLLVCGELVTQAAYDTALRVLADLGEPDQEQCPAPHPAPHPAQHPAPHSARHPADRPGKDT
ncbi:hypothetical protein CFP65_3465 [Kitasatospora sp. MMS16-BH015]|uniref:hypothetical protein n=1 Tax=Kitasatospora sp. MMS16-BH015 TaxID=2018025 RepID=UPI000CA2CC61|nr:hypothetical protein [Kitasatospora sp. MMS16-BH015]AUG78258.1 hypothetical protein CFP65_3465 [Kitasatospora sp. MMS16-BH015]